MLEIIILLTVKVVCVECFRSNLFAKMRNHRLAFSVFAFVVVGLRQDKLILDQRVVHFHLIFDPLAPITLIVVKIDVSSRLLSHSRWILLSLLLLVLRISLFLEPRFIFLREEPLTPLQLQSGFDLLTRPRLEVKHKAKCVEVEISKIFRTVEHGDCWVVVLLGEWGILN